jgi:hypothetical protein
MFLAWIFKSPLSKVVAALLKLEVKAPGGFEAKVEAAEQRQVATNNPSIEKLEAPSQPSQSLASPNIVIANIENGLRNELNKTSNPQQREDRLLRSLAEVSLRAGHEFIYNRIFGSQILFLKRLNEVVHLTVDQARDFLKPFADEFPVYNNYGFEAWLNFLTATFWSYKMATT